MSHKDSTSPGVLSVAYLFHQYQQTFPRRMLATSHWILNLLLLSTWRWCLEMAIRLLAIELTEWEVENRD